MKLFYIKKKIDNCWQCPAHGGDGDGMPICNLLEYPCNDISDYEGEFPRECPLMDAED